MALTSESFRAAYPEFKDSGAYPLAQIDLLIVLSGKMMNAERWGDLLDHGAGLFVAHSLALSARAAKDAEFGKIPGQASGIVTNKSVDKVSVGYDSSSVAEEGAGAWNLTTYGQQYIRLARLLGAGPVQVGVPSFANQSLYAGSVYAGPYQG